MELYLIRHAQSLNNARPEEEREEDPPLTELGHQQASRLAQWIPQLRLSRLVTSPFLRALQTTQYLAAITRLVPDVRVELHEQGGCMSGPRPEVMVGRPGLTRSQIQQQFPGFRIEDAINDEGWWGCKPYESADLASFRAARLIAATQREWGHTAERVAYVMHADFKLRFLEHVCPDPLEVPRNTSVSKLLVTPDEVVLLQYNHVQHLPVELFTE